jgi:hypothetical protein
MQHPIRLLAAAAATLALSAAPAFAEQVTFTADLTAASEVPPTDSTGSGTVDATLDTDTMLFSWTIEYSALTGPASAAHFHGPAAEGSNAPPVIPIDGSLESPIEGSATLTADQMSDLQAGNWYFNVHTEKYPDGEIRGQLTQGEAAGQ